jgi:phosphoglycolate phosphatase
MKRLIIYDLDGVLADTSQELIHAQTYVLSRLGASPARLRAVRTFAGESLGELIAWGVGSEEPQRVQDAEALLASYYADHAYEHSRLMPGALRLLDHFKPRTQVVLTDRPNPFARELMGALGILAYMADMIAGDSPYPRKPHPAGALALMAQAGVTPAETLLIGDRPLDVATGRNAGVFTVAVSHERTAAPALRAAGPDVLVEDLCHLVKLATRVQW